VRDSSRDRSWGTTASASMEYEPRSQPQWRLIDYE
jgi:hypothetical protein